MDGISTSLLKAQAAVEMNTALAGLTRHLDRPSGVSAEAEKPEFFSQPVAL
jgi:hypothetical protein